MSTLSPLKCLPVIITCSVTDISSWCGSGHQTATHGAGGLLHYHQQVLRKLQEAGGARRPYLKRLDQIRAVVTAYTGNPCQNPSHGTEARCNPALLIAPPLSGLQPWGGNENPLPAVLSLLAAADRGQAEEGMGLLLSHAGCYMCDQHTTHIGSLGLPPCLTS